MGISKALPVDPVERSDFTAVRPVSSKPRQSEPGQELYNAAVKEDPRVSEWMIWDEDANMLHCSFCRKNNIRKSKNGRTNPFHNGIEQIALRMDYVKVHQKTHEAAPKTSLDSKQKGAMDAFSKRSLEKHAAGYSTLFTSMFWLASESIATNKFLSFVRNLLPSLDPPPTLLLNTNGTAKYSDSKTAAQIIQCIDQVLYALYMQYIIY